MFFYNARRSHRRELPNNVGEQTLARVGPTSMRKPLSRSEPFRRSGQARPKLIISHRNRPRARTRGVGRVHKLHGFAEFPRGSFCPLAAEMLRCLSRKSVTNDATEAMLLLGWSRMTSEKPASA